MTILTVAIRLLLRYLIARYIGVKSITNGVWKAIDECTYQWGDYKMYRSIHGWTVWYWTHLSDPNTCVGMAHSRRVGNADLMSQAMELATKDAQASLKT